MLDNVCNSTSFYRTVLSSAVLNSNVSGLELGSEVCVPCNETCDRCNGPESVLGPNGCQSCRYAQRWSQCVRECDTTGKHFVQFLLRSHDCSLVVVGGKAELEIFFCGQLVHDLVGHLILSWIAMILY